MKVSMKKLWIVLLMFLSVSVGIAQNDLVKQ